MEKQGPNRVLCIPTDLKYHCQFGDTLSHWTCVYSVSAWAICSIFSLHWNQLLLIVSYIFNHRIHGFICLLSYEVNSLGPHHLHERLPRSLTHSRNTRLLACSYGLYYCNIFRLSSCYLQFIYFPTTSKESRLLTCFVLLPPQHCTGKCWWI